MQVCGLIVLARRWLAAATLLGTLLICVLPTPVEAHTFLQRSDPANNAVLRASPAVVRLWFSAPLDSSFSTAIVENSAYTYVNDRDAKPDPGNAREMEIALTPSLAPGIYAVIWRVASNADGYVLSGSLLFAIARSDGAVPGQPARADLLQARPTSTPYTALALFFRARIALVVLLIVCWACLFLFERLRRGAINRVPGVGDTHAERSHHPGRAITSHPERVSAHTRFALVAAGVLLCLALALGVAGSSAAYHTSPAQELHLQWPGGKLLGAFHATCLTTDRHYRLTLDVTSDASGLSVFTVTVVDAASGQPASDVSVSFQTTMLDMPMGITPLTTIGEGKGRFSARGDLSMGGLWQVAIQLSTADHRVHEAAFTLLMPY